MHREPMGQASGRHVLSRFVTGIPMPAALVDERGRFLFINDAWKENASRGGLMSSKDDVGRNHLDDLRGKGFNTDAGRAVAAAIEAVLSKGDTVKQDYESKQDGKAWEVTISRIPTAEGPVALLLHRDKTAMEKARQMHAQVQKLSSAHEREQATDAERVHLLHAAEQALQGPLTPIRIGLHLLLGGTQGELDDNQRRAIERIQRNVDKLRHMQEDMFADLRGLEDQNEPAATVELAHMVQEAIGPLREEALQRGVKLVFDHDERQVAIRCPPKALSGILLTLIHHGILATPAGGTVTVGLHRNEDGASLTISDEDPEIGPEEAEHALDVSPDGPIRSGLRHAADFVEQWDGRLELRVHEPARGLEVHISWAGPRLMPGPSTGKATQYA